MLLWASVLLIAFNGCRKNDPEPAKKAPVASFQFKIDDNNHLKVKFTNASSNATSYKWDFGDSKGTSTDENPEHTYDKVGTYTVKLTATGADNKTSEKTNTVTLTAPQTDDALLRILRRTWKTARVAGSLNVGPNASGEWFSIKQEEINARPCLYNHEYIFDASNDFEFKANGSFWFEGPVNDVAGVKAAESCGDESELATLKQDSKGNAIDISSWASGKYKYEFKAEQKDGFIGTLTLTGKGAFIGIPKASGDGTKESAPQPFANSTTYKVKKLVDGGSAPDTLELHYAVSGNGGVWVIKLVSYKNPNQEPALGKPKPKASFTSAQDASDSKLFKFTNNSTNAVKYEWFFGDNSPKVARDNMDEVSHTYTSNGIFEVRLVAFNSDNETDTAKANVTAGVVCTNETAEDTTSVATLNLTYKTDSRFNFGGFGGVTGGRIANPIISGINTSCWVNNYARANGAQVWGGVGMGIQTTTNSNLDLGKINFSTLSKKGIRMKVYSSNANTKVVVRLEKNAHDADGNGEDDTKPLIADTVTMTKTNEWEEITFNFSHDGSGNEYGNFLIYFDRGTTTAANYYFDDIRFVDVTAIVKANFTSSISDKTVTFTNTSANANSYAWKFGDGNTSTDKDPTHTYASEGEYTVQLVATGADNVTDTSKQKVKISAAAPSPVSIDFESAVTFESFGSKITFSKIENPAKSGINTSDSVLKVEQESGTEGWTGIKTDLADNIDFSSMKAFKMKVYTAAPVGTTVRLKFEKDGDGNTFIELDAVTTKQNAWEELTFDFTSKNPASNTYGLMAIFPDFRTTNKPAATTFHIDDIKQVVAPVLLEGFETGGTISFLPFGEVGDSVVKASKVQNPAKSGINTSDSVMIIDQDANVEPWAGVTLVPANVLAFGAKLSGFLSGSGGRKIKFKVYAPATSKTIKLKFENPTNASQSAEVDVTTTSANTWVELTADFTSKTIQATYTKFSIFADFQTGGRKAAGSIYYFDDFKVGN